MSLVRSAIALLAFVLGFATLSLPVANSQADGEASLVSIVEAAFDKPRGELVPPILIFPPVDADNRIRSDTKLLRQMASYSLAYGPSRRMSICVPYIEELLSRAGCWLPEATLDQETIRLCLAASGNPAYALTTIVAEGSHTDVTLRFVSNNEAITNESFTKSFEQNELGRIPGWIARTLLEHTGCKLSASEIDLLEQPQFGAVSDLELLTTWWNTPVSANTDEEVLNFLERNPHCTLAWEGYLNQAQDAGAALARFEKQQLASRCARLQLSAAVRVRELGRPRQAVLNILDLLPTHYDDTYFYTTLFKCGLALEDKDLVKLVLAKWRELATGYADNIYRAQVLSDWAWAARGGGWGHEVDSEDRRLFQSRLTAARRELDHAVSVNPDGWVAHAELIAVARGLQLPREFVDEHFAAATMVRPRYSYSYRAKFEYLRPRWFGTPAELVAFGKECFETGFWETRIPQFLFEAIQDAYSDPSSYEYSPEPFQSPELWELIGIYRREADLHVDEREQRLIANHYALWGALGGHNQDVAQLFTRLQYDYREQFVDTSVFPDLVNLLSMADAVLATTKTGSEQLFSSIRVDLAKLRFTEASDKLDALKPNDTSESSDRQFFRRAIELGRELNEQRLLNISGLQWKHAFESIHIREFRHDADVDTTDQGFVWYPQTFVSTDLLLVYPSAFRRASLEGTLRWTPGITYVEIAWRQRTTQSRASLRLYPEGNELVLTQGYWSREQTQLPASPLHFKITIGEEVDLVQVNEETPMQLFVDPPDLGTFSIRAMTSVENPGTFTVEDFKITLD